MYLTFVFPCPLNLHDRFRSNLTTQYIKLGLSLPSLWFPTTIHLSFSRPVPCPTKPLQFLVHVILTSSLRVLPHKPLTPQPQVIQFPVTRVRHRSGFYDETNTLRLLLTSSFPELDSSKPELLPPVIYPVTVLGTILSTITVCTTSLRRYSINDTRKGADSFTTFRLLSWTLFPSLS